MTQQQRTPTTRVNKLQMDYAADRLRELKNEAIHALESVIVTPDEYFDCLKDVPFHGRNGYINMCLTHSLLPVEVQVKIDAYEAKAKHINALFQAARDSIYIGGDLASVLEDFKRNISGGG